VRWPPEALVRPPVLVEMPGYKHYQCQWCGSDVMDPCQSDADAKGCEHNMPGDGDEDC
jgi:hypothetical protein